MSLHFRNQSADLEPDADGDGFGDETQDQCLGTAGSQNGCAAASAPVAPPAPAKKKKCKKHKKKHSASFGQEEEVQEEEARLDRKLLRTLIGV